MYSRNPREHEEIKIPENYAGNAFRNNIYTDIPPEEKPEERQEEQKAPLYLPAMIETTAQTASAHQPEHISMKKGGTGSIFSSLLPSLSCSPRFPFGHGIGAEELFILGIMLLVYTSGDENDPPDGELLLLLCILLFSG